MSQTLRKETKKPLIPVTLPIDQEFDIELANQLASLEIYNKHLYRPNTYLHKWWARRCGTTFRSILKHLVLNPDDQDYYKAGGLEGQIILDPMMGGGTTLHEAIRLGANVVGVDIDPIPVFQVQASLLEAPLKEIEKQFQAFFNSLKLRIGRFYKSICPACNKESGLRFVLYGLYRKCACGQEGLFIDRHTLRNNSDGTKIHICPQTYNILRDQDVISISQHQPPFPLYKKTNKKCECGGLFVDDTTEPYYKRYFPIAIIGDCSEHGLFFSAPSDQDLELINLADNQRQGLFNNVEDFKINSGPKSSDLLKRNIHSYLDLFSSRQLIYLKTAIEELQNIEPAIRLKIAMLISTSTEFNSMLCGYKGVAINRPGAIRHTFAHHAYSIPYTALENNPINGAKTSGTLQNLFHSRLIRGYKWALNPAERIIADNKKSKKIIKTEKDLGLEYFNIEDLTEGTHRFLLIQGSATRLNLPDNSIDHVVTDPPYFDSVQYSDLAVFFRVWLKQLFPNRDCWDYSGDDSAVNQRKKNKQYETVMSGIFAECYRVLKDKTGRMIFTFHHWNHKGWAELTLALKRSGFQLINRYIIHSENPSSVHVINQKALVHDVILVLGKHPIALSNWSIPVNINKNDSYEFCQQCGLVLGYLLNNDLTEETIRKTWLEKLN